MFEDESQKSDIIDDDFYNEIEGIYSKSYSSFSENFSSSESPDEQDNYDSVKIKRMEEIMLKNMNYSAVDHQRKRGCISYTVI